MKRAAQWVETQAREKLKDVLGETRELRGGNLVETRQKVAAWIDATVFGDLSEMKIRLAKGEVVYSDSFCSDFVFYVKNKHPIISICFSHPEHPFSKCGRLVFLLCSLLFSFSLSLLWIMLSPNQVFQEEALNDVALYAAEVVVLGALQSVYDSIFVSASAVSCIYTRRFPICLLRIVKSCGSIAVCQLVIITLVIFAVALIVYFAVQEIQQKVNLLSVVVVFGYSNLISFIGFAFVFEFLLYSYKRFREQRKSGENQATVAPEEEGVEP